MNETEKRMQMQSVLTNNNVELLKAMLVGCMLDRRVRICEDEFSTIVHNAKIEGQELLLEEFTRLANNFINPLN